MIPGARVQAAIEIIDLWQSGPDGLDRGLAAWGRANRYAGSGDRRAVADLVHDAVRRLRSAAWAAGAPEPATGRQTILGSLTLDGQDPEALFTGQRHAPLPLSDEERARLGRPLDAAPRPIRLDLPDWLAARLDHLPDAALDALRTRRAPLFLRVNTLRATPEEAIAALREDGIDTAPGPHAPTCLRVLSGASAVQRGRAWREGLVEVQDAASQATAAYAGARPGETVLDYCAGAGGKALAFAAAMQGAGQIHAHDIAPDRLAQLDQRARRAGARVTCHASGGLADLHAKCDLVFVDAPCSGSGAWRRNPDAKWRLTPERLDTLTRLQAAILRQAAAMVRPGGRLIHATCSILPAENAAQAGALLAAEPGFRRARPALTLLPGDDGDGFFACEMLRETL
jgi:16S rRNA (cytosine967-C5)-methyltransferase